MSTVRRKSDSSKGLTIERMRAFLALANKGSLVRAADGDPSKQALLSKQIRELGLALDARLTRPEGRGLVLTPAGEALAAVLRDLEDGLRKVSSDEKDRVHEVTIAASDSILHWLVLPSAASLTSERTRFRLRFIASPNAEDDVQSGRCHIGVVSSVSNPLGLTRRSLGDWSFRLFLPRGDGPRVALAEQHFVEVTGAPTPLAEFSRRMGFTPTIAVRCETFPQAARLVESGRYAALLPSQAEADLRGAAVDSLEPASVIPPAEDGGEPWRQRLMLISRERTLDTSTAVFEVSDALFRMLKPSPNTRIGQRRER